MKKKSRLLEKIMSVVLGGFCLSVCAVILTILAVFSWLVLSGIFYFKVQILTAGLGLVLFFGFLSLVCNIIELVMGWYDGKKN